ncbi:MAG: methyltransferase domain-containing protein [Pseudomonadota bacterium]
MKTLGDNTNAYYRFHARIYDLTRWTFLFGRRALVAHIAERQPRRVLEIGCGTGKNLIELKKRIPDAQCVGVDASADMLRIARGKAGALNIRWIEGMYPSSEVDAALESMGKPDVILFSYALSMFNPGYDTCLETAHRAIAPDGVVCVVDFHNSPFAWFRRWMAMNHVRMESQLLEAMLQLGELSHYREKRGLLGIWRYNMMMGAPRGP